MGVNLKEDENLVQVEWDGVEKGEGNLGDKVELESEEEVLNGNSLSEGLCVEQPAEEPPEKADVKSEIKEKVIGEPEEEKLGEVVDDDALGADWGLVINQADASGKLGDDGEKPDDGDIVPCEEPMEVVEDEAVPDITEKKEESVNQENKL